MYISIRVVEVEIEGEGQRSTSIIKSYCNLVTITSQANNIVQVVMLFMCISDRMCW